MGYRCAFLGCGPRAKGHASAYAHITRGEMVVLCDMNEERLSAFGDEFGVETRYTDLDEMLDKEKPDVVHCVTDPTLRVPLLTKLSEAGVPSVLVEKQGTLGGAPIHEDYAALTPDMASPVKAFAPVIGASGDHVYAVWHARRGDPDQDRGQPSVAPPPDDPRLPKGR